MPITLGTFHKLCLQKRGGGLPNVNDTTLEGGIYDKYNSDIACSLPGVHKLYNKLIAYQIFEIGFDRRRQCLKIDFEDFNETMAILKKSNWV